MIITHAAPRRRHRAGAAVALLLLLPLFVVAATADDDRWRWQGVDEVIAFGDVHGDFDALTRLLRHAGVVDDALHWRAGALHLVSLGDLLDRGPDSRPVMDLLMRLQDEAAAAGGRVHVVLGNHEQMNLTGDLRYVAAEEYAAFAGPQDEALRRAALSQAQALDLPAATVTDRPDGFFAHRAAFAAEGRYGRWLLRQRVLLVIDDYVFVHGGISPVLEAAPRDALEPALRAELAALVALRAEPPLQRPDLLGVDLLRLGDADDEAVLGWPPGLASLAPRLRELAAEPLFGAYGPFWHRGNAGCHALLEAPELTAALDWLGAGAVVVGHTVQGDHRIHTRLDGRVYTIDTGMLARHYGGAPRALRLRAGRPAEVISPDGLQAAPAPARPAVDAGFDDAQLARLLREGQLGEVRREDGVERVGLRLGDAEVTARVLRLGERERAHELAALRLDRLIGLDMVPIAVEREVDGRSVLLQADAGEWLGEAERAAAGIGIPNWCRRGHPFELVRVFDMLIGNQRDADGLAYRRDDLAIRLTDHGDAFSRASRIAETALPDYLAPMLAPLDDAALEAAVGDGLDRGRLKALRGRRDALRDAVAGR